MDLYEELMCDIETMRQNRPMVLNVTNYVVANSTANALLALGASPAMSHNVDDMQELTAIASALVVNIGTPSREFWESMFIAGNRAKELHIPTVFDPIAAGVVSKRTAMCRRFLEECTPAIVRGNASEIMSLGTNLDTEYGIAKGADATVGVEEALPAARTLARKQHCVVSVSGEVDYITDGLSTFAVHGGSPLMPLVTGLGCTATALTAAFACVARDTLTAAVEGMMIMAAAGALAATQADGPGTLQLCFYDALYSMTLDDLRLMVKVEAC
ncbi:MAG: hydroxyethylthiazole kinase [Desulfovibrionaceae bacterium]|jgi:hydroxyethylthiazole kinase|nr:hydroxyethylthiazole kinase [Desulfovibrionaceae bacterium]